MDATTRREGLISLNRKLAELKRRRARTEQSQRGWYDEGGVRQGGLIAFVRYFWKVLEPETPFVDGWPLWAMCEHLEAVTFGEITRVLMNVPPGFMKSLLVDVMFPAWEWGPMNMAHLRYVTFSYSSSLTERDNERFRDLVISPEYQALYGKTVRAVKIGATQVTNTQKGWKLASSVGGVGTGQRGNRVILDDPNNVKEAESEVVRNETNRWFRESMSNRLNDMDRDAIIIIMQRVHEDDVSGLIQTLGLDYTVLCIPMEYDWSRPPTAIGWTDPRGDLDAPDPDAEETGAGAWDERFPEHVRERTKKEIGPYAWCTPKESPILMGDLSLRPIGQVNVGDTVVGFEVGNDTKRARLKPAKVLAISKSVQPVFRIKLDSGKIARCTADHKWFTGRNEVGRKLYAPAHVGSTLRRICPPSLPEVSTAEDTRLAGWIAGFFDGEGSVSLLHRRGSERSSLITFFQTAERNLPLCEKLEAGLTHLGFQWAYKERQPTTLSASGVPWQKRRSYYLKSDAGVGRTKNGEAKRASRLALNQRFLHLIQPTKWRDRIIDTTVNGRMYSTSERVTSIEPDGVETVYGLTTETGNYVVWGLASSNSGQYSQSPAPRGGGLFKRDWWQLWDPPDDKFPAFEYLVASLDSSYTEKEENDPSALTVWGVFGNDEGQRRIMLVHAWRKHLQFSADRKKLLPLPDGNRFLWNGSAFRENPSWARWRTRTMEHWGLIEWVDDTCTRFKIDKLLIEAKASGLSAAQELGNRYGQKQWSIECCPVKGDKYARAVAVQPTFSQLLVYAPAREWSELVIDEMAVFPKGRFKDLTDSTTQAIKHLRDRGLAQTDEESHAAEIATVMHRGRRKTAAEHYGV